MSVNTAKSVNFYDIAQANARITALEAELVEIAGQRDAMLRSRQAADQALTVRQLEQENAQLAREVAALREKMEERFGVKKTDQ